MRVVLDTNVLLSGVLTRGICEALLDRCVSRADITIVSSEYILDEFVEHAVGKYGLTRVEAKAAAAFLRDQSEMIAPTKLPRATCTDKDDLPILGTAVAGSAAALVTGDRKLLELRAVQGIPIVSPREFFDAIAQR